MLVYGLQDPISLELRYVGKTCDAHPRNRLSEHVSRVRKGARKTHKERWIAKLLRDGHRPVVFVIEKLADGATYDQLDEAERFWIAYFKMIGADLTNATEGGDGWAVGARNPMHDPIVKKKYSLKNEGRRFTDEHLANKHVAGERLETKHRWRDSMQPIFTSDSYRAKQRSAGKKTWQDPQIAAARRRGLDKAQAARWPKKT